MTCLPQFKFPVEAVVRTARAVCDGLQSCRRSRTRRCRGSAYRTTPVLGQVDTSAKDAILDIAGHIAQAAPFGVGHRARDSLTQFDIDDLDKSFALIGGTAA